MSKLIVGDEVKLQLDNSNTYPRYNMYEDAGGDRGVFVNGIVKEIKFRTSEPLVLKVQISIPILKYNWWYIYDRCNLPISYPGYPFKKLVCECGGDSISGGGRNNSAHSHWCPKHRG